MCATKVLRNKKINDRITNKNKIMLLSKVENIFCLIKHIASQRRILTTQVVVTQMPMRVRRKNKHKIKGNKFLIKE